MIKIGILKEGKIPVDRRAPLTPGQCRELIGHFPKVKMYLQPSGKRIFNDEEYENSYVLPDKYLSDCDILLGVKEVQVDDLIPEKTYLFFSHTVKKQPHNKKLLKAVLDKRIRLIDYELLKDKEGNRLVGFGRWAGIVGAYNGFRAYSIRYKLPEPKPAHTCIDFDDMLKHAVKIKVPPIKILVTGNGRVAHGAVELLDKMGIKRISSEEFLSEKQWTKPVYVQIDVDKYNKRKDRQPFEMNHFFEHPEVYEGNFGRFIPCTDMLIMGAFWDPRAPALFTPEDMRSDNFRIRIIADIACDINGAIPSTLRATAIEDPFYGYNPFTEKEELAFTSPKNITMMTVDNLPCELPADASVDFGRSLIDKVFPSLLVKDSEGIIEAATIAENGELKARFKYLEEWVKG